MRNLIAFVLFIFVSLCAYSQVPIDVGIQILRAEDARRYDSVVENLMRSPNPAIRERAALAAGRIGDDHALTMLTELLEKDSSASIRAMAAFAIGEVESAKSADAMLSAMAREAKTKLANERANLMGRLVEAAGKIAAANPNDPKAKQLGAAIIDLLKQEPNDRLTLLLAFTAALRAKPEGAAAVAAHYLKNDDATIRSYALNTLARLRAKERLAEVRVLLGQDPDAVVRANAARVLGAAQDREALQQLVNTAIRDDDLRVRVSAVRALGSLSDTKAAAFLITRGNALLSEKKPLGGKPANQNELLEIATAIGQLMKNTNDLPAVRFLEELRRGMYEPEVTMALARVEPLEYLADAPPATGYRDPHIAVAYARGLATVAETKDTSLIAQAGEKLASFTGGMSTGVRPADQRKMLIAMPELTSAVADLKPDNIDEILRDQLENDDLFVRAAAAGAIADRPKSTDNLAALKSAFSKSFIRDKHDNDSILAIMDALFKLDKNESVSSLLVALGSPDYLVRKKAFQLLADPELPVKNPGLPILISTARSKHKDQVLTYSPAFGMRLGQVLNTDADYRRALSRKDGSVRAVVTTEKGVFTIEFDPDEAPLTVDNWVKLARAGYFNGLEVHRVVPNFVIQDGDPRGDGNGGPGWSIRCEINMLPYDRGAVGMALSGKDTGGSQWFVTHSPQPHLDGGYTVFGHVPEKDMHVIDSIVRGDRILSVKIIEANPIQNRPGTPRH